MAGAAVALGSEVEAVGWAPEVAAAAAAGEEEMAVGLGPEVAAVVSVVRNFGKIYTPP